MKTSAPATTMPMPHRNDSLPASVIGEPRPSSSSTSAPAASDEVICAALKTVLVSDLRSRRSTYNVHVAIAAIATSGAPSNTMLNANAHPGET